MNWKTLVKPAFTEFTTKSKTRCLCQQMTFIATAAAQLHDHPATSVGAEFALSMPSPLPADITWRQIPVRQRHMHIAAHA